MTELDRRWRSALRAHAELAAPTPEAWAAITERAADDVVDLDAPPHRAASRTRWLAAAAVVAVLALGAVALAVGRSDDEGPVVSADSTSTSVPDAPPSTTTPPTGDPLVAATGEVVTDATGTHLCGGYAETLVALPGPPTCDQIPLDGWDWDAVDGERTEGGTTWLSSTRVIGTYDGERIAVTGELPDDPPDPPDPDTDDDPDRFRPPCPTPPGGWAVTDPSRLAEGDLDAFRTAAEGDPQAAGLWIDEMAFRPHGVYTVAFTADLDRHRAELAALWGGPICVTSGEVAVSALHAATTRLGEAAAEGIVVDGFALELTGWGPDPIAGAVHVQAIFAPAGTEQVLTDLLGVPVRLDHTFLRPVD